MIPLISELYPSRMALDASAGLVVIVLHGYFLALAAKLLGDNGPTYDGRLTLDPTPHVDVFSLLGMVLANVAWVKPMDIRPGDIGRGFWGIGIAVASALLATFMLGRAVAASRPIILALTPPDLLQGTQAWFATFVQLSDRVALINLLPIFALTGAHLLRPYLPGFVTAHARWSSPLTLAFVCALEIWVW